MSEVSIRLFREAVLEQEIREAANFAAAARDVSKALQTFFGFACCDCLELLPCSCKRGES